MPVHVTPPCSKSCRLRKRPRKLKSQSKEESGAEHEGKHNWMRSQKSGVKGQRLEDLIGEAQATSRVWKLDDIRDYPSIAKDFSLTKV